MWDLPRPGLEPVSPALAGTFSTTVPPGKPWGFFCRFFSYLVFPTYRSSFSICCRAGLVVLNFFFFFYLFGRSLFFLTSFLEYNCFTMVCQFLLYNKVNQLYIYICSHISSLLHLPPSHPPYPSPLGGHKALS